jgi:DNA-binding winged helix-turn-helix (wHTH) protein/Tol biopolymer transport system component
MAGKSFVFRFGDVEVREREFSLVKAGEALPVEPKAFRVLLHLLRNPQKLIPKEELLNAVWGETAVSENSLTRSIALLRRLLGDEARDPRFIETVATVGYRWVCKVEPTEESAGAEEARAEPIVAPRGEKTAGSRKLVWVWALAGGGVLGLCLAGAVWYLRRPLPPPRIAAYKQLTHDGKTKGLAATDGSRLYVNFSSPNLIAQLGVNGGEFATLPIAMPGTDIFITDVSPDGSNALINDHELGHSSYSMWIAPVLGGAAKRLDDGYFGAFSPDGGSVIYSTTAGDIFMIRPDWTARHKLAGVAPVPAGGAAFGFAWSPDGKSIRFSTSNNSLWEMYADGSGLHRMFPDWTEHPGQCCGRWTRDGGLYLFLAGAQIWALDERRSLFRRPSPVPIQVTSGPILWGGPLSARDGKTIFVDGSTVRGELSRIDPKTGSLRPFLGGISAQDVSFSPDGKSVTYVAFPEGTLWRVDRDGSHRIQLTQPPDYAGNPRWSSDSKEIVFGTISPNGRSSIRRISAADGTPLWLMSEDSAEAHDPNWSPDGTRVLYCLGVPSSVATAKQDLRIVDLRSKQTTILPGSEGKWSPRWSPDGRFIAAFFDGPQQPSLPIFDSTTRKWHTVQVKGDLEYLSFSHDNRFIYFLRHGRDQGVFRIPVVGGKEERVVDLTDWHLAGFFGFSMSLDPDDAPLVLRDTGSEDIYALTLEDR